MQNEFDAVVIGGGIIGRLTAWHIARSGQHTLLLEQHSLDRPEGSSRGTSRMFGEAHLEDVYYDLAHASRYLWRELERETGMELLHLNGGMDIAIGSQGLRSIKEVASKLRSRRCPFEIFDGTALYRRYPQWRYVSNAHAIYSSNEGVLRADLCMDAAITAAQKYNLSVRDNSRVTSIQERGSGTIVVRLSSGQEYHTRKLVIAAGPWAPGILKLFGIKLPLQVFQVQTVYFAPRRNSELFTLKNCPVWEWEGPQFVYGFPMFEKDGIKVSFHSEGRNLKNVREFRSTPNANLVRRLRAFLEKHLPDAAGEDFGATTCLYTCTPDDEFVVDTIPGLPQVAYFAGCNGFAFHCAPAISKTLKELVFGGKTDVNISRFSSKRF